MKLHRNPAPAPATTPAGTAAGAGPAPSRPGHRLHTVATAASLAAAGLALATLPAAAASAAATPAGTPAPGHLPWTSGVYLPNATPASVSAFGAWRGNTADVATVWPNLGTWADFIDPAWLYQRWQNTPLTVAFGEPMLPENVPGVTLAACATGAYDSYWRQFGTNISAHGLGDSIIRLGWEFNGNWYIWAATSPATWAQCWQQIVTSARATAPGLQWDWNVNRGTSAGLADPTAAYPGDAYVTTIGVDSYDMWPAATTAANWNQQLNGTQGLMYWLTFAKAHGKKLAIPEWGNIQPGSTAPGPNAGGDDAAYVNDMAGFFQAHSAILAYESNFQGPSTGGVYGISSQIPTASAAYKADF